MRLTQKLIATLAAIGLLVSALVSWPYWSSVLFGALVIVVIFWPTGDSNGKGSSKTS